MTLLLSAWTWFRCIIVLEYEIEDGGLPRVLCMVAYVLDSRHMPTIRLWRGVFGATPPFDIGPDTLIVGYSLWAEMICFLVLGWRFPAHVYDLHTAYLSVSNILLPHNYDEFARNRASACAKSVARIQAKGMPIDMPLWNLVQENEVRHG